MMENSHSTVIGGFKLESTSRTLTIHHILTPARVQSIGFFVLLLTLAVPMFLVFVRALLEENIEGTRMGLYIGVALSALFLLPILAGLIDILRPKAYVFDRNQGVLTSRNKRLCSLKDISMVDVVRTDYEDHFDFCAQVLCGDREVCRFNSNSQDMTSATNQEKLEVYRIAGEISQFLDLVPSVEPAEGVQ